jgi:site-specific DNA-methyltransferase (adenine-specific)
MTTFTCVHCSKTYKREKWFIRHLEKCNKPLLKPNTLMKSKPLTNNNSETLKDNNTIDSSLSETTSNPVTNNNSDTLKDSITKDNITKDSSISETTSNVNIEVENTDGLTFLKTVMDKSIDLVLTDPPYITSSETGMGNLHKQIKKNKEKGITFIKTEQEWDAVKDKYTDNDIGTELKKKENYMKFGNIYGKKYSVQTEYGDWDTTFTIEQLDVFIGEYYKKLRKGGTIIFFFDIWKISLLKDLLEKHTFRQIRFIEWIKTNPQPLNSKINYLTNCREIALLGVKGGKPTFNSKYDNGIYRFPLQGGKNRFHPTQKSLLLFEDLIKKHSYPGDTILDTFLGSGTTAIASKNTHRHFKGCEISQEYYNKFNLN